MTKRSSILVVAALVGLVGGFALAQQKTAITDAYPPYTPVTTSNCGNGKRCLDTTLVLSQDGGSAGAVSVATHLACTHTPRYVGTTAVAGPTRADRRTISFQLLTAANECRVTFDGATTASSDAGVGLLPYVLVSDNLAGSVATSMWCNADSVVLALECP